MLRWLFLSALLVLAPVSALAQSAARPSPVAELAAGYAGFVDESTIDHSVFAGALRFHLTPRISVGPEVQYMRGPGSDRDLIVTGNLTVDLLSPDRRATPFVVVGGGLFRHSDGFGSGTFSSTEGALTVGAGARARVTDRVTVGGDFRIGWEPHYRIAGFVGISLGR